jgi:hypothetical protein
MKMCIYSVSELEFITPKGQFNTKDINVGVKGWGNLWEAASIYMKG